MFDASVRFISSVPGLSTPPGYSYVASSSGELVLFAGQVALDAQGNLVGSGDFDAQVRSAPSGTFSSPTPNRPPRCWGWPRCSIPTRSSRSR